MTRAFVWFAALILLFGAIAAYQLQYFNTFDSSVLPKAGLYRITLAEVPLQVMIARTPSELQKGLSGTKSLPQGQGILFVFPKADIYPFWMKDMNFSIDIFWLSEDGRIVYIAENVSPDSYPAAYKSDGPATYVLELNAGFATAHNVQAGSIVHFQ